MCGIYGWQWKPSHMPSSEKRYLLAALLGAHNDDRGGDSWGWYNPVTNRILHGMGTIGSQGRLFSRHDALLAHTRKATVGAKTIENAHPFAMGQIIGAHNGAVFNHEALNKAKDTKFEVDSMHVFDSLDKEEDLKDLFGYGAIEWIDKRKAEGNIYLCRLTSHADLGMARTEHGIVWSSSKQKLEQSLWLTGMKAEIWEAKSEMVYAVRRGEAYETEKKLFFSTYQSTNHGNNTGVYGSSHEAYSRNYDRAMGKESKSELEQLDEEAKRIEKTMGKKKAKKYGRWCQSCKLLDQHKSDCPSLKSVAELEDWKPQQRIFCNECGRADGWHAPKCPVNAQAIELNPRPTPPATSAIIQLTNPKQEDLLPGVVIICVSCENSTDSHASWCPIGRSRTDVGGGSV